MVNKILGKGGSDIYPPIEDPNTQQFIYDTKGKAEKFNNFFLSHSTIDVTNASLPNDEADITDKKLENVSVTEREVSELISNINPNKASGPDGISPRILKMAGQTIVPSLTRLIKLSLRTGEVPKKWKEANVIPLHKKGARDQINNYRPVSLLPAASKILERVIFKKVYNYLNENNLLSRNQSGFRPNDSTVNQLSFMYHEFCKALDEKKELRIIFCDISKAFDKVWHHGLLYKLKKNGITGDLLAWFQSYLVGRKQRVVLRGHSSSWGNIQAGVPQGSVLGPLLFLVYINDITDVVNCNLKMFADDTCLYVSAENSNISANILNHNIENVSKWANQWLVNFNPNKTKSMLITNKINKNQHPPLYFNNNMIEEVNEHKHLGVLINNKLNWKSHTQATVKSVSKLLDVMHKLSKELDRKSLERIYEVFVRSKLEYASIVWDDCFEHDRNALENCQMRAARIVTGARRGTSREKLYDETGWLKLEERRENSKLSFMYKVVHKTAPDYLVEILPNTVNSRQLRNYGNYKQYSARTEKFRKSLLPDCVRKWNQLENDFKKIPTLSSFRKKVFTKNSCSNLFFIGTRKFNIVHAQLRMNCSSLNAHLYRLHVVDSPSCACSHSMEDTSHFFFNCPLYYTERQSLRNVITRYTEFKLDTLLFGDNNLRYEDNVTIIFAVHAYIRDSGRLV